MPFDGESLGLIHQVSQGAAAINVICDRAMSNAQAAGSHESTGTRSSAPWTRSTARGRSGEGGGGADRIGRRESVGGGDRRRGGAGRGRMARAAVHAVDDHDGLDKRCGQRRVSGVGIGIGAGAGAAAGRKRRRSSVGSSGARGRDGSGAGGRDGSGAAGPGDDLQGRCGIDRDGPGRVTERGDRHRLHTRRRRRSHGLARSRASGARRSLQASPAARPRRSRCSAFAAAAAWPKSAGSTGPASSGWSTRAAASLTRCSPASTASRRRSAWAATASPCRWPTWRGSGAASTPRSGGPRPATARATSAAPQRAVPGWRSACPRPTGGDLGLGRGRRAALAHRPLPAGAGLKPDACRSADLDAARPRQRQRRPAWRGADGSPQRARLQLMVGGARDRARSGVVTG